VRAADTGVRISGARSPPIRMPEPSNQRDPRSHAYAVSDDTPLTDFDANDRMVGMDYFPDELGLPSDWRYPGGLLTS
jgi:hypothetical protein